MRKTAFPLALILVALVAACADQAESPPNIVLIISDDHAWSDHGFMGNADVRTPSIDKLAAEGMLYTRGYVPTALCRPSLATMMTGLYAHQHGITGNDPPGGRETNRDPAARASMEEVFARNRTVAALLRDKGYVSRETGKWWEGNPLNHGFTAAMTHGDVTRRGRHGDDGLKIGREGMQPIFDFIDSAGDKPFFIWYAPFLPHTPHNPPDRLIEKHQASGRPIEIAKYFAMIEWLDETVGQLMSYLDDKELRDNTLVLYVVDNGWIQAVRPEPQLTRAKMSPYDAGIRTPIIVNWPGKVAPGRDDKSLAGSIDLAPTILRAAGIEPPSEMPGINLRDTQSLTQRKALFGALFAHTAVDLHNPAANLKYRTIVRTDGWKLILPHTANRDVVLTNSGKLGDWVGYEPELYNVLEDPHEEENRAAEHPEIVTQLRGELLQWWLLP
ncbi:MAG: sulfatase [bacterium]|nr:sulfatase [bacterium]